MLIREHSEKWEADHLSEFAAQSRHTRGRQVYEEECEVRTCYQRDRDRIIHSKAFRRLKLKTQVFIAPEGDHFRTRLTHTLEVAQIARTVARALRLNEDLTEAIALGHDLGHTPFGHAGEEALDEMMAGGFRHNYQSLRVVEKIEGGKGLNLTWEVRDGILHHTGPMKPATLEGQVVKICDRIAYINHDIDDALRGSIITRSELPLECLKVLGSRHSQRINTMVKDLIQSSMGQPGIRMSPEIQEAMDELRKFLFKRVYIGSRAKSEETKAKEMLKMLYQYYLDHHDELPGEYNFGDEIGLQVCDYVAGMTDRYAIAQFTRIFVPDGFRNE
ncbi:deoxyguanosinetriphosphate triphosphohydrolase [Candidatus Formimonas warabiya]|uniref:Deoxyguanosinetriphosphate triphosphohydrolase-like protein n=1 Tax=Formimonas warabiya TaxID=1761012 RepID=A0A3G1KZJ2_FORW1|nr:deoxyguanosinetriphosphate triphosphohydrolase [Candidatus Formimonas warabiya]ATW27655.1 deoxyguanosinetriphosphate triphosphohydrolase [Candidatus Formimonas warabiya]